MIPFPPVVEPDLPGAFITVHPRDVSEPHGLPIPWMTGLTSDEGAIKSACNLIFKYFIFLTLLIAHHFSSIN